MKKITNYQIFEKALLEKAFSGKENKNVIIKQAKSKEEISLSDLAAKNAKHYDPTKFAVPYIFTRHYGIPTRKTYCPGIKNSCRNGNCEHQGGNLLQRSA